MSPTRMKMMMIETATVMMIVLFIVTVILIEDVMIKIRRVRERVTVIVMIHIAASPLLCYQKTEIDSV